MISGLLVAPMVITPSIFSRPSMLVNNWSTSLSDTLLSPPVPLVGANASNSSKKTIQGETCFAFLKTSLSFFSDSPTHLDITSGPLIAMKLAADSVAMAFAIKVFPVPGGP